MVRQLVSPALARLKRTGLLLADAGFEGGEILAKVEEKELEPNIPKVAGEVRDERRRKT